MSDIPINSAAAAASLSMADVKYAGVKLHDTSKVSMGNIVWSSLVGIVAILGVASALFSMWIEASLITCVAFAFPLVTGPCILVQRKRLQWMPSKSLGTSQRKLCTKYFLNRSVLSFIDHFSAFREESNQLRRLVNALATHRLQLAIEVSRMERQITRMKDVEDRFQQVVRREGKSVQQYRQLIRENAEIQAEIKVCFSCMDD